MMTIVNTGSVKFESLKSYRYFGWVVVVGYAKPFVVIYNLAIPNEAYKFDNNTISLLLLLSICFFFFDNVPKVYRAGNSNDAFSHTRIKTG